MQAKVVGGWVVGLLLASAATGWAAERLTWVRVTEHADFKPRDSSGEVVFGGKMWLLGGWYTSRGPAPNDVWNSTDGVHWTLVTPHAPWVHPDLPTTLVHQNKMWLLGGWAGGRMPGASASNQVWWSADGTRWQCATAKAPWPARLGAAGAVFQGKMWLLGGIERYYDGDQLLGDVWNSADGVHWNQVTKKAPWPARAYHGVLVYQNKLWLMGGGNYVPTYRAYNDVWCSSDGREWKQVTGRAAWTPRIWFSSLVYQDRMWLLGGWSNQPSKNWSDVWYSSDGARWKPLVTEQSWSPRHEQSAYVHDGKMWILAGNEWPLVNDVWRLEIPAGWLENH
jgi:hypothetical protein